MTGFIDKEEFEKSYQPYKLMMEANLGSLISEFEFGQFCIDEDDFDLTYNHKTNEDMYANITGEFTLGED